MTLYFLRRLLLAVPTLAGITLVAFFLLHLAPGDPTTISSEEGRSSLSPEALARMREVYHLDDPLWKQYVLWISGLARGDLGVSLYDGQPVGAKILSRMPATLVLALVSLLFSWGVALPVGIGAALSPGGRLDRTSGAVFYVLTSMPTFWIGLLLQLALAVRLGWLPLQGMQSDGAADWSALLRILDRARHLILPALCMAAGQLAFLSRYFRAGMLEALEQDFIRTARAKGLPERAVILRHALGNALLPMITLLGLTLPALAGGSVVVERVFSWPGAGLLFFQSLRQRDLTTLMGLTLFAAVLTLAGSLGADLLYAMADPRVRYGETR